MAETGWGWRAPAGAAGRGRCSPRYPGGCGVGLAAQKGLGLHGLPQGVDGGVRHLGGVYQELIPVDGVSLGVAHGREQHAAAFRLAVHLLDGLAGPVAVSPGRCWSVLTIFSAGWGTGATHRWQLTHWLSSATIFFKAASYRCTPLAHWRSHTRQLVHRSRLRTTS